MNINQNQDVTPYDRMDDALLQQLLGTQRIPSTENIVTRETTEERMMERNDHGGLNCRGERVGTNDTMPTFAMGGSRMTECSCPGHFGVVDGVLAALYLPVQEFDDIYDEETALQRGTLFRALDLPFRGGKGGK